MLISRADKVCRMLLLWEPRHHKVLLSGALHDSHQLLVNKMKKANLQ